METSGRRDDEFLMRAVMVAACAAALAALAGCDGDGGAARDAAADSPPETCTLDPRARDYDVTIVGATPSDTSLPGCVAFAATWVPGATTTMEAGTILGVPVRWTSIKAHDSRDPSVACVYDIVGFSEIPESDLGCYVTVKIAASIAIPTKGHD